MGALTWATIALLGTFLGVDAAAHFTKYKYGETFSAFVWWAEKKTIFARILIGVASAVLFSHLEFHIP